MWSNDFWKHNVTSFSWFILQDLILSEQIKSILLSFTAYGLQICLLNSFSCTASSLPPSLRCSKCKRKLSSVVINTSDLHRQNRILFDHTKRIVVFVGRSKSYLRFVERCYRKSLRCFLLHHHINFYYYSSFGSFWKFSGFQIDVENGREWPQIIWTTLMLGLRFKKFFFVRNGLKKALWIWRFHVIPFFIWKSTNIWPSTCEIWCK